MGDDLDSMRNKKFCIQQMRSEERYLNPNDISVPPGYQIEVFAQGLNTPIGLVFTENGDMLIADAGYSTGNPKVILLSNGQFSTIAEGFNVPITGVNYRYGDIYVSHKSAITVIKLNGTRQDIIRGLPSYGDYFNNQVTFSNNGKMYFGQGTATNSGVVGLDNKWIIAAPYFHDYPGAYILVNGINYETSNLLIPSMMVAYTGAFSAYDIPNLNPHELIKGRLQASGSIMRSNLDGSNLEMVAWGFRNPIQMKFDRFGQLYILNQGYDNRGSRPIANAPDELQLLSSSTWYGWPDYAGGEAITLPRFTPEGGPKPDLLLLSIPSIPPRPYATFTPDSNIMGFDFNLNSRFGQVGDAYIAEFGAIQYGITGEIIRSGVGHRVSKVDMTNGQVTTFAINKSGFPSFSPVEGGFGSPSDVAFGPDGAMYITDYSTTILENLNEFIPNTGVIWRISKIS
jgi:glucose/arabinose dehydrogenase